MLKNNQKKKVTEVNGVKVLSISKLDNAKGKCVAIGTVSMSGIAISGVRLMDWGDHCSCEMPTRKGKDRDGNDSYFPLVWFDHDKDSNKDCYQMVTDALIKAYEEN